MMNHTIYQDLAARTKGAFLLGVVGPVRTGKSTFIKRFMETLVLPQIEDEYVRERARDELPQSGSGKTIMTTEPKFVPEEAVSIRLEDQAELSVRLIDCVGYMVKGVSGQFEDGQERLVTTPWFDHEISMTEAAESGTRKVIAEHSTIGIVVTTDGSICEIPREDYAAPEERVIRELQELGKPFVVLLNCADPRADTAQALAAELSDRYQVECLPVNCQGMQADDITRIIRAALMDFPLKAIHVSFPEWFQALEDDSPLRKRFYNLLLDTGKSAERLRDGVKLCDMLQGAEEVRTAEIASQSLAEGKLAIRVDLPRSLYYKLLSEGAGQEIGNDRELLQCFREMSTMVNQLLPFQEAIKEVKSTGYGVVLPGSEQMTMEEPQIIRRGGRYSVKLKACAPAIHLMMTNVETEVTPALGGEGASEEIMNFLLQGFDGDVNRIWESNIFGRSLNELAEEGLIKKIRSAPENSCRKLRDTLQKVVNDGSETLFCILL